MFGGLPDLRPLPDLCTSLSVRLAGVLLPPALRTGVGNFIADAVQAMHKKPGTGNQPTVGWEEPAV